MSTTLSPSGVVRPANGDTGATFWQQIANFFTIFNSHKHTGQDGTLLAKTQSIPATGYTTVDATIGIYTKVIDMTAVAGCSLAFDAVGIEFRDASTGEAIYPKITKTSSTSYTLQMNTNAVALTAIYI